MKTDRNRVYEGIAFQAALPDAGGTRGTGLQLPYRVCNHGMGGPPNHRFLTQLAVRDEMMRSGWIPEGLGPDAVFACVPRQWHDAPPPAPAERPTAATQGPIA